MEETGGVVVGRKMGGGEGVSKVGRGEGFCVLGNLKCLLQRLSRIMMCSYWGVVVMG